MNALALCSGIGGLELGLARRVRGLRTVCHVERDAYAAAVLVARMGDAALAPAPIWDDVGTFDGRPWRGLVDLVASGLPCQPYSVAGKQRGHADERALWPEFVRIVAEVEPAFVFLENVPPFLKHLGPVYDRLLDLGFEFGPPVLCTAHEVGAPDRRRRLFVGAAHADRARLEGWRLRRGERPDEREAGPDAAPAPDADGGALREQPGRSGGSGGRGPTVARRRGDDAPDADVAGLGREWHGWTVDGERETFRHVADGCDDRCRIAGSPWEAESPVYRVASRTPAWVDRLRVLGNCVTPEQAALAWGLIFEEDR